MLQLRAGRGGQPADGDRAPRAPRTAAALHRALPHLARLLGLPLQRPQPPTSRREVIGITKESGATRVSYEAR